MRRELSQGQPGGFLIAQHLAHMMLIQTLRAHLAQGMTERVGWFYALADKNIGAAITAMHDAPAHCWTLQVLAKCAGLSRSSFALKFKAKVGASPMEYLSRWRMLPCIAMVRLLAVAIGAALRVERRTGVIRLIQDRAVDRSLGATRAVGAILNVLRWCTPFPLLITVRSNTQLNSYELITGSL
jgi:AraC-like DNA-binding protein